MTADLVPFPEAPPPPPDTGLTLPHDPAAERAVLGGMLTSPAAITDATSTLTADDLYEPRHGLIFDAIEHLYARGEGVDAITVADHLRSTGNLRRAGGAAYLHELAAAVVVAANTGYHADIVASLAARRRLHAAGTAISALALTPSAADSPTDLKTAATALLEDVRTLPPGVEPDGSHPWAPRDLAETRRTSSDRPRPTLMTSTDGACLMYPGMTHSFSGESTTGKSWILLAALAQQITVGHPVVYLDFEDRADTLIARLNDMGIPDATVDTYVRYIAPDRALDPTGWGHLERAATDASLVVIDGVTEAMTMQGWSLLDNEDIARWAALLPKRLAKLGPAVAEIDHVVKDKEARGRYAIGGAHKLNGITGAAYNVLPIRSFAIGEAGASRIVVAKDRHGGVGPVGHTAAEFHVRPDTARHREAMVWEIVPSQATYSSGGAKRLTGYMERVSRAIEAHDGLNKNALWSAVKGDKKYVDQALDSLIAEGHVRTEDGSNRQTYHYLVAPYREESDRDDG